MSSPTVAILVRTKGRPRFLSRALENIAQQTFTDYTVCVINDGGDEQATRAVIEASPLSSNAQDSSRVQLLTTAGDNMEAASNAGLAATTSEYVAIHDDDDLWAPEFLERTVAALEESGAFMCTTRVVERYERENADGEFTLPLGMLAGGVPELMVAAALRHAAVASDARRTELLEVLRTERAYLLAQILGSDTETSGEAEAPAPFPAAEQTPALPEPLGATVRAARDLFTETSLTAGFEWAMSDRAHSWDAEHRRQLERARAIGGGYSAHGVHGAHGAEETHPVAVESESSDEAPAETNPGLLARVARRLRG